MTEIILHEEAFDELRGAFVDAGIIQGGDWVEPFTIGDITYKLYEYIPTEEDIQRRKEFESTPFGQAMKAMWAKSAKYAAESILERNELLEFLKSDKKDNWQWPETMFPTKLKIRLPDE